MKLKLELNVLSKLVDLVHGNTRNQSMTLNMFEDNNTIQGQPLSDGTRGMSGPGPLDEWLASDNKGSEKQKQNDYVNDSGIASSSSQPSDENDKDEAKDDDDDDIDKITRTLSEHSRSRIKESGRDSDVLYADFLRSMS